MTVIICTVIMAVVCITLVAIIVHNKDARDIITEWTKEEDEHHNKWS